MLRMPETKTAVLTPAAFVEKWGPGGTASRLNERAGAQPHFLDLCRLLGVDEPTDPDNYCFERGLWGVTKGRRYADVWMRGHFAWEYKAPGGDLGEALKQLMQYALPLENPPLLVVSDRETIQIHTHFTGHPSVRYDIALPEIREPRKLALLRSVFRSPRDFRPRDTTQELTAALAASFAEIAYSLRKRGVEPFRAAHFLTQCAFCCFAESVEVLPDRVFRQVVQKKQALGSLQRGLTQLFHAMSVGEDFGAVTIPWFNGGLFKVVDVPLLVEAEVKPLAAAAGASWASIDPSILGTLFERGLDPSKRNQMGAHYTDATTIERLIDPVVRRPLVAEWDAIKREISGLMSKRDVLTVRAKGVPSKSPALRSRHSAIRSRATRAGREAKNLLSGFMERLQSFRVLDPACGSGNFLFLALKALKDVEHQVNHDAEELGLERQIPVTGPHNLLGIELNEYAAELARATVWIGELQWRKEHGYGWKENPILDPLDQIECRDALLSKSGREAKWPRADVVVGNPPFLGTKKQWSELGVAHSEHLRRVYAGRVPGFADLVCYWFEKARAHLAEGKLLRAGLVATNSIRGGSNREVLDRVVAATPIFEAWSDLDWINDGAAVRVSLVAFGRSAQTPQLDGRVVDVIHADLTSGVNLTVAEKLPDNMNCAFVATVKSGPFDVSGDKARGWLRLPNPNGRSNADVVKRWANGMDMTRRWSDTWIVDFGVDTTLEQAAHFEAPFAHVEANVKPIRRAVKRQSYRDWWWLLAEPIPRMRAATSGLRRFVATPVVAKFRLFVWLDSTVMPDHQLVVVARADDTVFGILHSRLHEIWSLRVCTWMGKGNDPRYTPTTCFETYPFPADLGPADTAHQQIEVTSSGAAIPADLSPAARSRAEAIARAARRLVDLRDAWLNPAEWIDRLPEVVPLGMDRSPYPDRIVAKAGFEKELSKRTLTNLYNQRPAWLVKAHEALDAAVAAAYGWVDYSPEMPENEILQRLLALNRQRAEQADAQGALPFEGGQVRVIADKLAIRKGARRAESAGGIEKPKRKVAG